MAYTHQYLLIFALCILYATNSIESANDPSPSGQLCNLNSNVTTTKITKNIDSLLTTLVQTTSQSGYSVASVGSGSARVFGLAQCRSDVPSSECSSCIKTASKEIKKMCPDQVDARLWYDYCFIRYNTNNFFGKVDTEYLTFYYNNESVMDPDKFNKALGALMGKINKVASAPGSKGMGKGHTKISDFSTLYTLSQCTRDLSQLSCRQCLAIAVGNIPFFCHSMKGCRIIYSSCSVRYESYPFFFPLDAKSALESSSLKNYTSVVRNPYV